jgi:hypothetical protein
MLALNRALGQTIGMALLGAIWASRAFHHAGQFSADGATEAPALAQVTALHDVFVGMVILLAAALGMAIWAFSQSRQPEALRDAQTETTG